LNVQGSSRNNQFLGQNYQTLGETQDQNYFRGAGFKSSKSRYLKRQDEIIEDGMMQFPDQVLSEMDKKAKTKITVKSSNF